MKVQFKGHSSDEICRYLYRALNVEAEIIDRFLPKQSEPEKREPMADIMAALRGLPIAAFQGQDHESHITMKTSWSQDPMNGGSDQLKSVQPAIQANIREHMFLKYAEELQVVQAQEQISLEQAAQRISRLNQIAIEEEQEGSPAYILAKAEELRAQTADKSENRKAEQDQYKLGLDTLELGVKVAELEDKAEREGRKLDNDALKMGLELLKTGYQEAAKGAQPKQEKK
jgi:hypothetical protein